ncbi:hypothetical protein EUTSA_v10007635mg [Eutrema salsugineum]|uniref:Small ribosomal subunit protein uS15c n=1 Tax=Eutrema salsugineum TaxID=72664 RepID=V4KV72_EUTSA|nr:uncharacterized protein LOC18993302 [Eutrema salsugineum]ESQ35229.1 hypothetical protein EUTSA_v10007635mg [Eutrema salsugineum]
MALLVARRRQRFISNPTLIRFFSNSASDPPPKASVENPSQSPSSPSPSPSPSDFSYSSPFTDIKTTLKQKLQQQQEQGRKPFVRSDAQTQNPGSTRFSDNHSRGDLGINLAKFQRRPTVPPSRDSGGVRPSQSRPQISFEELYKQKVVPNSADPRNRKGQDFNTSKLSEKLSFLKSQSNMESMTGVSLRSFKGTLKSISNENVRSNLFGGGEALPMSVFGKEMGERKGREGETEEMMTEFLKIYGEDELGEKLRMLRPEGNKEQGWFSLQELNQRLVKLRQVEEKDVQNQRVNISVLKNVMETFQNDAAQKEAIFQQNSDIRGLLGGTPEYKHYPPKEDLVEAYFHTDNLSSTDKMKIELTKVREEYKMSESDCGSARVQVAQLTTKIKHLSSALHKKDKHSRKGLIAMVQKRKKLLKYLRRTDWDSYCLVLSKLRLRDNPDHKL